VGEGWGVEEARASDADAHDVMHARHRRPANVAPGLALSRPQFCRISLRLSLSLPPSLSLSLSLSLSCARVFPMSAGGDPPSLRGEVGAARSPPAAAQSHAARHGNPRAKPIENRGEFPCKTEINWSQRKQHRPRLIAVSATSIRPSQAHRTAGLPPTSDERR
jgi:hypothetical protein